MLNTEAELILQSPVSGSETQVGIIQSIPVSITLSIADVREPDKRNSTFSKTISIPGDKTANKLFEHIFEVTTDLNSFNPNLKIPCKYFVRGERVFNGDLQLLKIKKKGKSPYSDIFYEVSIIGRLAKAFLDLGNALLTDLDFSDLNHVFTYANRNWTPTLGTGYTYPYIDYGITGGNGQFWDFQHLKPAIFENEYWERIFASIGKTYSGSYNSSTYANSIIIPDVNAGPLKMNPAQINSISYYAGKTSTSAYNTPLTYIAGQTNAWQVGNGQQNVSIGLLFFNDDTTAPFFDGGGNYNTGASQYQAPGSGNMKFNMFLDCRARLNAPAGTTYTWILGGSYTFACTIAVTGGGTYQSSVTINLAPGNVAGGWVTFTMQLSVPSAFVPAGSFVYATIGTDDPAFLATAFFSTFPTTPITTGTTTVDFEVLSTSWISGTTADAVLPLGFTVDMNQTVPKNVKQIDFLMSIIKAENIYVELDLTDDNNYIIEKREDFFLPTSQGLDWTSKWDYQRETEIIPMGELDFREYIFTYKTDGDKYNKLYKEAFNEVYGQERILVDNDFIKNTKKNELIFAATPLVGNSTNTLVYPVLAQADGVNLRPMDCQIRRLYWGGIIFPGSSHGLSNATNSPPFYITSPSYAYAGHLDNPFNPTIDLCWDNPLLLFYNYPGIVYTNNGLYNRNYRTFIEQITDENSKLVRMWIYLKAVDIATFTFRKKVWIEDSWYIVNKIMDYDPQDVNPCLVELLRLTHVDDPIIEQIEIWDESQGTTSGDIYQITPFQVTPNNNSSLSDGESTGDQNIVQGENSNIIGGYGNMIVGNL